MVTAELAVTKAEAWQSKKKIAKMKANFAERHSKVTDEVWSLKKLLNQKEI